MKAIEKTKELIEELNRKSYEIRRDLLTLSSLKTIHIGGCLSACDILTVLWQAVMDYDISDPAWEERDRFLLSKWHCQAAVAFHMAYGGLFHREEILSEYGTDNTRFSMAPCKHTNAHYESSATGSLGQGLPIGCGIALALKKKVNQKSKVFVLLGDGELQEGSNWEAVMLAGQKNLSNLIAVVDNNSLQFDGGTKEIVDVESIESRFHAFGWEGRTVDGHDILSLLDVFSDVADSDRPVVINAHTVKGKGVPYMENNYLWHAGRIKQDELEHTLKLLENTYRRYTGV